MTSSPTPGIHAAPVQWMTQADLLSLISDSSLGGTPSKGAAASLKSSDYDPHSWVRKGWVDVFPLRELSNEYFDVLPAHRKLPLRSAYLAVDYAGYARAGRRPRCLITHTRVICPKPVLWRE